jgi:hypothetical protein
MATDAPLRDLSRIDLYERQAQLVAWAEREQRARNLGAAWTSARADYDAVRRDCPPRRSRPDSS